MLGFFENLSWKIVRRLYPVARLEALDFIDLRARQEPPPEHLMSALREALNRIAASGGGFGELVTSHLKVVVATAYGSGNISTKMRTFTVNFTERELSNPHYLASRLVWAATFVRLYRDSVAAGEKPKKTEIRRAALEQQLRFVRQFPNSEEWVAYLHQQGP